MSPEDQRQIEDEAREFEVLVEAMQTPPAQQSDRTLLTLMKYAHGAVEGDKEAFNTFYDALEAARA